MSGFNAITSMKRKMFCLVEGGGEGGALSLGREKVWLNVKNVKSQRKREGGWPKASIRKNEKEYSPASGSSPKKGENRNEREK